MYFKQQTNFFLIRFAKLLESLKARQGILDDLSQRMNVLREIEALTSSLKELEPQLEAKVTLSLFLSITALCFLVTDIMQMRSILYISLGMRAPPFGDGRFASEARFAGDGDQGQKWKSQSYQRESEETASATGKLSMNIFCPFWIDKR